MRSRLECRAEGVGVLLGPGINLKRSPLGGRNFEYFSEDPVLSGRMAAAFVRGVQARGVGACLKHLVANEHETGRMYADSIVDERTLREVYLRPFEIAVARGRPVDGDGVLQPPQRRVLRGEPAAAARDSRRGVGLQRHRHVGLAGGQRPRRVDRRRPASADAGVADCGGRRRGRARGTARRGAPGRARPGAARVRASARRQGRRSRRLRRTSTRITASPGARPRRASSCSRTTAHCCRWPTMPAAWR